MNTRVDLENFKYLCKEQSRKTTEVKQNKRNKNMAKIGCVRGEGRGKGNGDNELQTGGF